MTSTFSIDESQTAKGFTPAASVPSVFGQARVIKSITIHHWGALGQTHDGVVDFFVNGPGATSAHFVASAGRVNCIVSPPDAAWHAGTAEGNATSIGIECRPEATDEDYQTVADLVRYLRAEYGDLPLVPHRYWFSTACPGVWDLDRIDSLARAGGASVGPSSATPATPTTTGTEEDMNDEDRRKLNAIYDALFNGGTSMPEGKPLKDLIHDNFTTVKDSLAKLITKAGA